MQNKNNEVVVVKSNVLGVSKGNVVLPDFKEINLGEEPRKLKIKVKKAKKADGTLFNSITGYAKLPVYDLEGRYLGEAVKRMSVHFRKTAFKNAVNVHSPEDDEMKSGYLYVKAKGLRIPSIYKIVEETDKDGNVVYNEDGAAKLKYPEIWIESDVIGLEAMVTSQTALDVDSESNVIDAEEVKENPETGELITEEYDTEECMFGEDSEVEDEE